jgi:hypothetical protein
VSKRVEKEIDIILIQLVGMSRFLKCCPSFIRQSCHSGHVSRHASIAASNFLVASHDIISIVSLILQSVAFLTLFGRFRVRLSLIVPLEELFPLGKG